MYAKRLYNLILKWILGHICQGGFDDLFNMIYARFGSAINNLSSQNTLKFKDHRRVGARMNLDTQVRTLMRKLK